MTITPKIFKLFLLFITIGLVSCNSAIFDATTVIENGDWSYSKPISFDFEIQDTAKRYDIFLEVEHRTDYAFENAYCLVESYAQGVLAQRQQVSLELASPKGNWNGECSGERCVRKIPFMLDTMFPSLGAYKIILSQYTRHEILMGINSLRLIITETKTNSAAS